MEQPQMYQNQYQTWTGYPHSYHGTPANEYIDFAWSPLPFNVDGSNAMLYAKSHTGLATPGSYDPDGQMPCSYWPAQVPMIASHGSSVHSNHTTPEPHHDLHMLAMPQYTTQLQQPMMTTPPPRRTLTDEDRRDMCIYAQEHPNAKQTEIGARFKVDRSTVSKVLRSREKYMSKARVDRTPIRKERPRRLEIEKALGVWALQLTSAGTALTDELIRDQGARLASSFTDQADPTRSPAWVQSFMQHIATLADHKDSFSNTDDLDDIAVGMSCVSPGLTPSELPGLDTSSPLSTRDTDTPSHPALVVPDMLHSSPLATIAARRAAARRPGSASSSRRRTEPVALHLPVNPPAAAACLAFLTPAMTAPDSLPTPPPPTAILRSNSTDGLTVAPAETDVARRASAPGDPSAEDARCGLDTAWRYLQARRSLDGEECVVLGRMMERLRAGSVA